MRKLVMLLLAGLLVVGLAASAFAQEKKAKAAKPAKQAAAKEFRWHGNIIRFNADKKTLDVQKGTVTRTVMYSDATKWTKGKDTVAMPPLKEGMNVIVLGKVDEKGQIEANRIDLRNP